MTLNISGANITKVGILNGKRHRLLIALLFLLIIEVYKSV